MLWDYFVAPGYMPLSFERGEAQLVSLPMPSSATEPAMVEATTAVEAVEAYEDVRSVYVRIGVIIGVIIRFIITVIIAVIVIPRIGDASA